MLNLVWKILSRGILIIGGLIIFFYGVDALLSGATLLPASRFTPVDYKTVKLAGFEARIFGMVFLVLGAWIVDLALGGRLGIIHVVERKLFRK